MSNKKPLLSGDLAVDDNKGLRSAEADQHRDRITRFGSLKHRSKEQENFLFSLAKVKENYQNDKPVQESISAIKAAQKLNGCANFLHFKNFYTIGQTKLTKLQVCNQHLLCPFCAGIRASKAIQKYSERVDDVLSKNRSLKPVLITLTVKNGTDLAERSQHLIKSFRTLLERRRDYLKKGWGFSEFCKINGAMYSYENTFNEKTGEWHPHIHMFALLDHWIDQSELSEYWHSITGDSMIVDIRRVKRCKEFGYSKAAAEVCKYALKFGDLSVQNTWEAFKVLKGKRLSGAFGSLWGVKIPDSPTDECIDDDLPYLEMVYKFIYGKKSYYNLEMTRHVSASAKREEEDAQTTDRTYSTLLNDAVAVQAAREGTHRATAWHRKKQAWQLPPITRIRIRQRIRRWDGYFCVMRI